jgi:ABC-2 type transport system ATP-binding protein
MPVTEFIAQSSQQFVRVRTLQPEEFREAMRHSGATVVQEEDGALSVSGLSAQEIGDIAFDRRLPLHQLSPQLASLEEAFMELTQDSVEYRGAEGGFAANHDSVHNDDRLTPAGK